MTEENKEAQANQQEQKNDTKEENQNNEEKKTEGKKLPPDVPYDRFRKINDQFKANKEELEAFKTAKKEAEEKKLQDDGKLQELLTLKDKEFLETKTALETEKKNNKLEKLKNKSLNLLNKQGIIDGEDGLKFLNLDEFSDKENPDEGLLSMVNGLKESKPYLFGSSKPGNQRNADENKVPGSGGEAKGGDKGNKPQDTFTSQYNEIFGS